MTAIGWVIVGAALCFFAIHGLMTRGDGRGPRPARADRGGTHASP